jgi:hypothetical protein
MSKQAKTILIVAVIAAAAYLAYAWYKNKKAQQGTSSSGQGTNLNSVAPELIGGSTGPAVGPSVEVPITITLTDSSSTPPSGSSANPTGMQTAASDIPAMNSPDTWRGRAGSPLLPADVITSTPFGSQSGAAASTPQGGWHA